MDGGEEASFGRLGRSLLFSHGNQVGNILFYSMADSDWESEDALDLRERMGVGERCVLPDEFAVLFGMFWLRIKSVSDQMYRDCTRI